MTGNMKTDSGINRQVQLMNEARSAATFNSETLTSLIYGGMDNVKQRRIAWDRFETTTDTKDMNKLPRCYGSQNREEMYDEGLEMGKAAFEDTLKYKHNFFKDITPKYQLNNASPFGIHMNLFMPSVKLLASWEQQEKWMPDIESGRINGVYVQTEVAHGSFIRGLETTATFDPAADQFDIHCPTLTSTKMWPGGLGYAGTHALVMAQLVIGKREYGPHAFMVQLREIETGRPFPGIELGDVGLKMSYNRTDNGIVRFNHVRVPRDCMLMGHAKVERDGSYVPPKEAKGQYSGMTMGRNTITLVSGYQLAQAVTIATRYSVVREQGLGPNGGLKEEIPIFGYKTQNYRLLTSTAKAYAIFFAYQYSCTVHNEHVKKMDNGQDDFELTQYNHALTSGFKTWATNTASDGAEDARKCCGGHGYLAVSGVPEIAQTVTALCTLEGESYVLWQQVYRYLLKCVRKLQVGKVIIPEMKYLMDGYREGKFPGCAKTKSTTPINDPCAAKGKEFLTPSVQLDIFRHRAVRLVFEAAELIRVGESTGMTPPEAWNKYMVEIVSAARAHTEFVVLECMVSQTSQQALSAKGYQSLAPVLGRLSSLFALSTVTNPASADAVAFVEDGYLNQSQLRDIRDCVDGLLAELYPDAIALTDAWDFTDGSLCSALGCKDGNAYERLMSWIDQVPINQMAAKTGGVYEKGWNEFVKPALTKRQPLKAKL